MAASDTTVDLQHPGSTTTSSSGADTDAEPAHAVAAQPRYTG
jgi:hypothetical protein